MPSIRASFPMTAAEAQAVQAAFAQARQLSPTFTLQLNPDVALPLVLIPPGEYLMGLTPEAFAQYQEWKPGNDQGPENGVQQHRVQVHRPFYLGRTAVTQAQWQAIMPTNPAHFKGSGDLPMENVTPQEADLYCTIVAARTGQQVRLPSESEWEYACRAGSATLFHFGDALDELWDYAWYRENASMVSHPVGLKRPNPWGLYDMHGGIDEFCQDAPHPSYAGAPDDQRPWLGGDDTRRLKRGGSWYDIAAYCCSAHSSATLLAYRSEDHGLRVVMELPNGSG